MTNAETVGEDHVITLITMLATRGYEEEAHMLEQSMRSYATTTSEKIVQILGTLELLMHKQEEYPVEVRSQLESTASELRGLLEQANNPWPWRFAESIAHLFKKWTAEE